MKEAIRHAKAYAAEVFADERVSDIGVEEIEYDDSVHAWRITLGMSRPRREYRPPLGVDLGHISVQRDYRVFTVSDHSGSVTSVKMRESLVG